MPKRASAEVAAPTAAQRDIAALDWPRITGDLEQRGVARLGPILQPSACVALANAYADDALFRSRIVMARHGFGSGEYKYFAAPLPALIAALRRELYAGLVPVANDWAARLGREAYPADLDAFLARCHAAGQHRPTPLLLEYGPGDYNCLHQDVYGPLVFPVQVAILLSRPGEDFTGGEFVVVEQRPRMQSRAEVIALGQGEAVAFAVRERPMAGKRGDYRVAMRHGVSRILSGRRHTLGIIFHDGA